MKLYDIPRGSKILLTTTDGETETTGLCTFHKLDGAYSVIETPNGGTVYLSAAAPLKQVDDHYELEES